MRRVLFVGAAAALGALSCVSSLPASGLPCPCGAGWQCCPISNVCVPVGGTCPTPSCIPDCSGGRCGPNECGTSCGACVCNGKTCREDQICTPVDRCGIFVGAARPPKVMLAVDKSGSMKTFASSDTQWGCSNDGNGNGYNPSGDCKWNALRDALAKPGGFLDQTAASARHGLAIFSDPNNVSDSCASGGVEVAVPDSPGASIEAIKAKLNGYTPMGGTPSASTLGNIAADSAFARHEEATASFVILITDGMPNCNASLASCNDCTNGGDPTRMCGDVRNCLDSEALIQAVQRLRAKEIYTVVVGFGAAFTNPAGREVLDQAAIEGGMPQKDADTKFYLAVSNESLGAILDKIAPAASTGTCLFTLARAPEDPDALKAVLTDKTLPSPGNTTEWVAGTDWEYADEGHTTVAVKGDRCLFIQTAPEGRYRLDFIFSEPL